jgi:hypothetical protein
MGIVESEYQYYGKCDVTKNDCDLIIGNVSKDIEITRDIDASDIRADLKVKKVRTIRLWGRVEDHNNKPVDNALVKLVREVKDSYDRKEYVGVADSITDCNGFYQFSICVDENNIPAVFKVFVGKQALKSSIRITKADRDSRNETIGCLK